MVMNLDLSLECKAVWREIMSLLADVHICHRNLKKDGSKCGDYGTKDGVNALGKKHDFFIIDFFLNAAFTCLNSFGRCSIVCLYMT